MTHIKHSLLLLIFTLVLVSCSETTSNPSWVINEVMVENSTNYVDKFGQRNGWIEIYNNTAKTQNLAGCFLTNERGNPKKYAIPQGDVETMVKPHQHVLFSTDNEPFHGTFHTNFKLDPEKENYIALYDVDGKTLLDEIIIPAGTLTTDKTYGYKVDGMKYDADGNTLATVLDRVTPSSNNQIIGENPKIVELKQSDAKGSGLTLTSMLVVFAGLLLLFLAFFFIGKAAKSLSHRRAVKSGKLSTVRGESNLSGEVLAAISTAIYEMKEDQHDIESTILTIHQVKRDYSPWSSKLYGLRENPKK